MKREILFRGKRQYTGEWAESVCPLGVMHAGHLCDDFDPETVGQFTGLTDKNGKKIFEGDVVKVDGKAYEVKYMLGQFFIGINMPIAYKRFDCEVIGNIHDNPELLEAV